MLCFSQAYNTFIFFFLMEVVHKPMFTVSEALNKGWELTKKHWQRFLLLIIVGVVFYGAISLVGSALFSQSSGGQFIMQVVSWILSAIVSIVLTRFLLNAYDGKSTAFDVLLKLEGKMVLSMVLFFIIYTIAITIGLILLIVPGIIVAIGWYFASYLIVDKKMDLMPAIRGSWEMTKGNRGRIFWFSLAIALPAIILSLAIVGSIVGAVMGTSSLTVAALVGVVLLIVVGVLTEMVANFGLTHIYRKLEPKSRSSV